MELLKFKHKTQVRVRNYEIDWQGIVHNAVYSLYFEVGRIEYFKNLGIPLTHDSIQKDFRVVLATNDLIYRYPAHFDDLLTVYTRTSFIHNTSFGMEGCLIDSKTGRLIAENKNVHVWLDAAFHQPATISDYFRKLVQGFEGENVEIDWPSLSA
jgi:acyl-CoA thioester hydrolase